ncbi:MAG: hypothetical protein MJB57_06475 [Gemmatimonadetes bacterium]|nr:hypothetical protein [Gemmatimonadota bacterium]
MKTHRVFLAAVGLAFGASPTAAQVDGSDFRWQNPNYRPISGVAGVASDDANAPRTRGISGIRWTERGNKPFRLHIIPERLCVQHCDDPPDPNNNRYFVMTPLGYPNAVPGLSPGINVSVGADRYIVALQVCTNDRNDPEKRRIKGLRLWGATLNPNGTINRTGGVRHDELPNCRDWATKRSCLGDRRVAVGVIVHWNADHAFSGIELRCGELYPNNVGEEVEQ